MNLSPSQVVAIVLMLVLVDKELLLHAAVAPLLGVSTQPLLLVIVWSWLALLLGTIVGLMRQRAWGVYLLIALVPVSTFLLSVPLIPFVTGLAPVRFRPYAMMLANIALAITAWYLLPRKTAQSGAARSAS